MFSVVLYRLKDKWAFATQGEIGPGFYKSIEPVYVFPVEAVDAVWESIERMRKLGLPKTSSPDRGYEAPVPKALGLKSERSLAKSAYGWTVDEERDGSFSVAVYAKGEKKPLLEQNAKDWESAVQIVRNFEAYAF